MNTNTMNLPTGQAGAPVIEPMIGEKKNILGHTVTVKLRSSEAADNYVFEVVTPPGLGIPPHSHTEEDEVIYVQSGIFEVMIGEEVFTAEAGAWLNFKRPLPHGFRNIGNMPGKTLWFVDPGKKFEAFFDELGNFPPGPPDLATVSALFAKYGMTRPGGVTTSKT